LPKATLGKGFAEGLRGFAESLGPSAKQPAPVVSFHFLEKTETKNLKVQNNMKLYYTKRTGF
jgi:hypothetical protein